MQLDPLPAIAALAEARRVDVSADARAAWGQYFTPEPVARFMADELDPVAEPEQVILDPGAGTGTLGAAAARSALHRGARAVHLIAVESEPAALRALHQAMDLLRAHLGPRFRATLVDADFLDAPLPPVHRVIANPPWLKLSPRDPRGGDAPNAYARFMERAAGLLRPRGQMVFLVPRSFASGAYFQRFRARLHEKVGLEAAHVFDSRRETFRADAVLQESVIVRYRAGAVTGPVRLSSSAGAADLALRSIFLAPRALVAPGGAGPLCLPGSEADLAPLAELMSSPERLDTLGLAVHTGPVVAFRTDATRPHPGPDTVPMLWMQHVRPRAVRWPIAGLRKAQHIDSAATRLLVPNQTMLLIRRFSAKEEPRRLTAALLQAGDLPGAWLGLENHLNYLIAARGPLDPILGVGLQEVLLSATYDRYFRALSGNTQIGVAELRELPLPGPDALRAIGRGALGQGLSLPR